ncbi:MAG: hypothetical protein IJZ25_04455 [Lachnospiraceae bacterium]|nr:hypothetical protein [Lachnospiraceae bacterium]
MNSLKRKLTAITLFLTMIIGTIGCNKTDNTSPNSETNTNQNASPTLSPEAGITTDSSDEWTYGQVAMGGGGFVSGIFSTCEENVYYARTDVGGAYRFDNTTQKWVCLSYGISEEDKGYYAVDGFAVEPNAANRIFMLVGTEYFSSGRTAVMYSEDYGETFTTVEVTDLIKNHGNGYGRQNGERIAIDPNNSNTIYAGGRTGGLIKSTDGGKTWASVSSFPVTETDNGNGINGIVFDSESNIYITVSRKNADNVYFSNDDGATWTVLNGLPTQFMPQRIRINNDLIYITYGESEGPSSSGGGGIYTVNTTDMTVTDISPANKVFGDVVCDPGNPDRLVACTESVWMLQPNGSYGDEFYVSTDGGASWDCINDTMKMNNGGVEWITNYAIHWCGCLMLDPFNTDTLMVVSGNGIFRCDNIWDAAPEFTFAAHGLEETVPLDCISIPGGELFTAIGDYDGFEHTDVTQYGRLHTTAIGSTGSIAVAAQNTDIRLKLSGSGGVGGTDTEMKLLYSEDGGDNWTYITNKPNPAPATYGGNVTITADGSTIVWSTSDYVNAYYSTDKGQTWNKIDGLHGDHYVYADTVNPNYVYAIGKDGFLVSSDGGKSFTSTKIKMELSGKISVSYGNEGVVYIPCEGAGLFYTEDHGETVARFDSVKTCKAVGLGKGKTEDSPYVIYIWGQPTENDAAGIYMSEDNGATWTRINNDENEFGGTGNGNFLVGDYNIYGRCYMSTTGLGVVYCDKTSK